MALNGITGDIIHANGFSVDARKIIGIWLTTYAGDENTSILLDCHRPPITVDMETGEMLRGLWMDWHHAEWKLKGKTE